MASLQQPAYQPCFVEQMWIFSTFNIFWAKLPQKSLRASIPRDSFLILWAEKFETMTLQQALDSSTTVSEYQNREHPLPAVFQGWLGLRLWPQGQHQSVLEFLWLAAHPSSTSMCSRKVEPVNLDQSSYGDGSKPWYLVNPKIAGKWMFIH